MSCIFFYHFHTFFNNTAFLFIVLYIFMCIYIYQLAIIGVCVGSLIFLHFFFFFEFLNVLQWIYLIFIIKKILNMIWDKLKPGMETRDRIMRSICVFLWKTQAFFRHLLRDCPLRETLSWVLDTRWVSPIILSIAPCLVSFISFSRSFYLLVCFPV